MAGAIPDDENQTMRPGPTPGTVDPTSIPDQGDGGRTMFEEGGPVEDSEGSTGTELGDLLALALSSVKAGLAHGRQKFGLVQQAGLRRSGMPAVPATQSESGIPPERPFPRLEPTPNPFGKRAEAEPDADDRGGIPDNDADDTETA